MKIQNQKKKTPDILYVGRKALGNYSFIQDAINNVSEGDTIFIYKGTYYENIIVNKTVNIIGENKETTIINEYTDKENDNFLMVFHVLANHVKISNLTVTNNVHKHSLNQTSSTIYGILIKANNTKIQGNIVKGIL